MASEPAVSSSSLILRQVDRHPIGCLDGRDLAGFERGMVQELLRRGILRQRADLIEADGMVFQAIGDARTAFSIDGGETSRTVDSDALEVFEIEFLGLCRHLRATTALEGPPVELYDHRVAWLGAVGRGSRRRGFYMARAVTVRNAVQIGLAVKGRAAEPQVTLLTPTERSLPADVVRLLASSNVAILALDGILDLDAPVPLSVRLPTTSSSNRSKAKAARLVIDTEGFRATLDGIEVGLRRREFAVLQLLAVEAADEAGFVSRHRILDTIKDATGQDANDEQVNSSVSLLRKALTEAQHAAGTSRHQLIETKKGVGYRLRLRPEDMSVS